MATVIDLAKFRSEGSRVYAGRERGEKVREAARLADLDTNADAVFVRVPEDTYSVNSSFFLGLFGESIRKLGGERFRDHYRFEGADISEAVENGIREALNRKSPL